MSQIYSAFIPKMFLLVCSTSTVHSHEFILFCVPVLPWYGTLSSLSVVIPAAVERLNLLVRTLTISSYSVGPVHFYSTLSSHGVVSIWYTLIQFSANTSFLFKYSFLSACYNTLSSYPKLILFLISCSSPSYINPLAVLRFFLISSYRRVPVPVSAHICLFSGCGLPYTMQKMVFF